MRSERRSIQTWAGRPLTQRLRLLATLAFASIASAVSPASATSSAPPFAVIEDCRERAVLVPGVEQEVREHVPTEFELVRDPLGRPLLVVDGARCEQITAGGKTAPSSFGLFMAMIESPDGAGCLSRWPVVGGPAGNLLPTCNFYPFFTAHTNPAVVRATREVVRDAPIYHAPNNDFQERAFDPVKLGAPFRFRAPSPTPSPFELEGIVRDGLVRNPLTVSFWGIGPSGPGRIRVELYDVAMGQLDARLRAAPGSEMAELLGTVTPTPLAGLSLRYPRGEVFGP